MKIKEWSAQAWNSLHKPRLVGGAHTRRGLACTLQDAQEGSWKGSGEEPVGKYCRSVGAFGGQRRPRAPALQHPQPPGWDSTEGKTGHFMLHTFHRTNTTPGTPCGCDGVALDAQSVTTMTPRTSAACSQDGAQRSAQACNQGPLAGIQDKEALAMGSLPLNLRAQSGDPKSRLLTCLSPLP